MEELKRLQKRRPLRVGVAVFDEYELLDLYGPMELIVCTQGVANRKLFEVYYVGVDMNPVAAAGGTEILPDFSIDAEDLPDMDILLVPGGMGTRPLQQDENYIQRLKRLGESVSIVLTVCTGSMLFAKTGLLDGKRATTNKVSFLKVQEKYPSVHWVEEARWVVDGKYVTSSGVSAGMDMTNDFLVQLLGDQVARKAAVVAEYVPQSNSSTDPFSHVIHAGDRSELHQTLSADAPEEILYVAVVIYENFELLDTFGPCEMFKMANVILANGSVNKKGVHFDLIGETPVVKSFGGPRFRATTFDAVDVSKYEMILLPGGIGTIREMFNPKMRSLLIRLAEQCRLVMTVCSGSAVLASTGLLKGQSATTNKLSYDLLTTLEKDVGWIKEARWVVADKYYTASGVSAGIDLSLKVLEDLYSKELAEEASLLAEYTWEKDPTNDPFCGSIPPSTLQRKAVLSIQSALIKSIFTVGFTVGAKMYGITSTLAGPAAKL